MRAEISPFVGSNEINQSSSTLANNTVRPPCYRFNSKPDAFMNNNVWKAAMANIIDKIETAQYNQLEIDRRYNVFYYLQGDGYIRTDKILFNNPTKKF